MTEDSTNPIQAKFPSHEIVEVYHALEERRALLGHGGERELGPLDLFCMAPISHS